jgi:hypothetical protein
MATTTNFGWETPDDTDLVKDGAAAMRTLGNSIDTSFVDLKGGTSGQILAKASNTDLDYTWITNDIGDITAVTAGTGLTGGGTSGAVSLAIDSTVTTLTGTQTLTNKTLTSPVLTTPSISNIDAKGDLLAGTADNTIGRLAIGTNGQVLTADSAESTGMKWATPAAGGGTFAHITTVTFSASSSIDLSNIFSTTYENYFVIGNYTCTADNDLNYRYRVSGADDSSTNYNRATMDINNGAYTGGRATGQTSGRLGPTRSGGSRISITGHFIAPFLTQTKHSQMRASALTDTIVQNFNDIGFNSATSFTGLTVFPGSGTVTGSISIFGIKNS